MKKIYSLVLMAVILLVGTNAWAQAGKIMIGSTEYSSLDAAFKAATNGAVIELVGGPVSDNLPAWFGETSATEGNARSIKLKLNGNTYSNSSSAKVIISITRGKLEIVGPGKMQATYGNIDSQDFIRLYGTYEHVDAKTQTPFAHLVIGEDVVIENYNTATTATAEGSNALTVDVLRPGVPNFAVNASATANTYPFDYSCDFYKSAASGWGVANGVKIEVYGKLNAKKYALKVNGCIREGKEAIAKSWTVSYQPKYKKATEYLKPYNSFEPTVDDRNYSPYILIGNSAKLYTNNVLKNSSVALYSAGYSRIQIEGECEGSTGVYVKSGDVTLNNAIVSSNFDDTYQKATNKTSGVNGAGSALTMESNNSYAGGMNVTVQGDSKLTAENGYAIEENVPQTTGETKVEHITITGGTFVGGQVPDPENPGQTMQGTMVVSQVTAAAAADQTQETTITIIGAQATAGSEIGDQTLADYLSNQTNATHVTYVEEAGKTIMVISEGDAPTGMADFVSNADLSVKWTGASKDIEGTFALKELEINEATAQVLTVKQNATFKVERVILGANAKIIVEPGGKFIVTGAQGIVAPVADNIVLQASSTNQGLFIFNPAVTSNRHPNATVQVYTQSKQLTTSPWTYVYQRFALPVMTGSAPTNDFSGTLFEGNSIFKSYAWEWDGHTWTTISGWNALKPFKGYQLANNSADGGVTYTFKGELVGNGDAEYNFPTGGFDFFGSSHVAPIYIDSLLKPFENTNMEASVWIYNYSSHQFDPVTSEDIKEGLVSDEIKPFDGFVLRLRGASGQATMSYASAIWGNPNLDAVLGRPSQKNPAPARNRANDASNRAFINVMAENGYGDLVKLVEKDYYTNEFDNGSDASKFIFDEGINLYATTEAGDLARVATDNLMGTLLSFRSGNSTEYTIILSNVIGEDYALRDNVTGQVIAFAEGATYTFTQDANTTVPARFEVIDAAKVPTAIDNVEEAAKTNGIYTVTGQYMGRDFTKVPAGVYIVNGIKVVK